MNTVLLHPTDVLFFRDGRPMEGSLAGHGAAWPLPNVTDAAFHAALHRSGLDGHRHDQIQHGQRATKDIRQFGSLLTAGPFPVQVVRTQSVGQTSDVPANGASLSGRGLRTKAESGQTSDPLWYFPRPLDLMDATLTQALLPTDRFDSTQSSLPDPLEYAVANRLPPTKESGAKAWLSAAAYQRYLHGGDPKLGQADAMDDADFSDAEANIGIAIDAATGTTGQGEATGKIYSARYLRLRDDWRLGVFAQTQEKNGGKGSVDLIPKLINERRQLLVGGQQRLCTASLQNGENIPLPFGKWDKFTTRDTKYLVKWILLAPAIWPETVEGQAQRRKSSTSRKAHPGGWLPNWIDPIDGSVLLRIVSKDQRRRRRSFNHGGTGYATDEGGALPIAAKLVAAIVPKPIPVTGWALPNDTDRPQGGAKSTHLAVPAGAVYYFEAESEEDAMALANALNWHGDPGAADFGKSIKNRRSTLLGEKGYGLGVCGTWSFYPGGAA